MTWWWGVRLGAVVIASAAAAKEAPRTRQDPPRTGCEIFGPDFHKLEGSDTCVKLGGGVRVESSTIIGGGSARGR